MSLKKDKQKVLGEVFDDERVREFLQLESNGADKLDYHLLERAYRGMKAENFSTFVKFFVEEGRDINAVNRFGETLLAQVQQHREGGDYAAALLAAGAR